MSNLLKEKKNKTLDGETDMLRCISFFIVVFFLNLSDLVASHFFLETCLLPSIRRVSSRAFATQSSTRWTQPPFQWSEQERIKIQTFAQSRHDVPLPTSVRIVEVGPRDGLQNEERVIEPEGIHKLITLLEEAGLQVIESGAFVSKKRVPAMAGTADVLRLHQPKVGVSYPVLIPSMEALEEAAALGVRDVAIFTSPSDGFNLRNIHKTTRQSLEVIHPIIRQAKENKFNVRGYVSCVLGCPVEGYMEPSRVGRISAELLDMGCDEISLGDTIGAGTPEMTEDLLCCLFNEMKLEPKKFAGHFHDTGNRALENILVSLGYGITTIDSSVAGIGGCPFAKGIHEVQGAKAKKRAVGNVATEKVVWMFNNLNIETGVDVDALMRARNYILAKLT